MSIYVGKAEWKWRGKLWAHLLADNLDELHIFAGKLGLKRSWFQYPPKASRPHYDITLRIREIALTLGAIPVDHRIEIEKANQLRKEYNETL